MLTESGTVELKRKYVDDIKKTVIAFANGDGGTVYIGVEDDGAVTGVEDPDGTMLQAANALRDAIRPDVTLFVACNAEELEGKTIVTLRVQRGTARPYYLAGKGIRPEGVFVRFGASTVPATEAAILDMIRETSGDCYEASRSLNQQLTFQKAGEYFQKQGLAFGEQQKRTLGLIGSDGTYTNLALLLSEQCIHTLKLAVFQGSRKTVFRDRAELTGSLLNQLDEAFAYIDRFNNTHADYRGLERVDVRDYPVQAIREALLNAIIHRDYSFRAPTLISIFDDRIEFVSVGGLVRGLTKEDILLGVSAPRNEQLANVFYRLRLIEAYGTGLPKIQECYREQPVQPVIEIADHAFKVTLPNLNYGQEAQTAETRRTSGLTEREATVLALLEERGSITRREVEKALGVSQATAILALREMTRKGLLRKTGGGRTQAYCLPDR